MKSTYPIPGLRSYIGNCFANTLVLNDSIVNPSDQSLLGQQARSTEEDIGHALQYASDCFLRAEWYEMGEKRADILNAIADRLVKHIDELAYIESVNTGVVLAQTKQLMAIVPLAFRGAARQILEQPDCSPVAGRPNAEHWYKPWGPALCLAPWNAPAPIGMHKLASAIGAGAPAILKPSEYTPYTTQRIFEILAEFNLPHGLVQLVHGASEEGARLVADTRIKAVSFTGGLRGGRAVSQTCMEQIKPVQLELGGHNPFIVFDDANWEQVFTSLKEGLTNLNGQWCRAVGQVWVPQNRKEEFLEEFKLRFRSIRIGSALLDDSEMGPMVHRQHKHALRQTLLEYQNLGGQIIQSESKIDLEGAYQQPCLISSLPLQYDRHEIFGPIATIHGYRDVDSVIDVVNRSSYGLASYIFGNDEEKLWAMARKLNVGSVKLNGVSVMSISPDLPRTAWGYSGLSPEGTFATYRFFQGASAIGMMN